MEGRWTRLSNSTLAETSWTRPYFSILFIARFRDLLKIIDCFRRVLGLKTRTKDKLFSTSVTLPRAKILDVVWGASMGARNRGVYWRRKNLRWDRHEKEPKEDLWRKKLKEGDKLSCLLKPWTRVCHWFTVDQNWTGQNCLSYRSPLDYRLCHKEELIIPFL